VTNKQKIKQLAINELTNTNPFKNKTIQAAIIASTLIITGGAAFSIGSDHGADQHHYQILISQGITPPPRIIHNLK